MSSTKKQKRNVLIAELVSMVIFAIYVISQTVTFKTKWTYAEYNNGYKLISYEQAYNDDATEITIPAQYEGRDVVAIETRAFYKNNKLKKVTIPDTVTELGSSVFKKCKNLETVKLSKNISVMGGECFKDCESLTDITLPDSLTELRGETFMGCSSLKSVVLPQYITEIKGNTFENCSSLEEIEIPSGVTRIAAHAFYGCSSLSYVFVPDTVTEIGSSAFRLCKSLKVIMLPPGVSVKERAFKESPTVIQEKEFSDEDDRRISEELYGVEQFHAYIVHAKDKSADEITYINNMLYITNSPLFAEAYPDYEVIDENIDLEDYLKKAKTEGCKGVVVAMYTEIGSEIKGKPIFVFGEPYDMDSAITMVVPE